MFLAENTVDWNALLNTIVNWCLTSGIKLLLGLIVLFIVFKVINFFTKRLYRRLQKRKIDLTISRVGTQILRITLKLLAVVCFIGYVGVETASISALITSAGVGVGLALQGSLSNFAGGIILIIMRPFRIGDTITSSGVTGTVEDIHMFYTVLATPDNKVVHIPNGTLANNVIVNNSLKDKRRVDITMSIAYDADFKLASKVVLEICEENDLILKDPKPFVGVDKYSTSSVDLTIRAWVNNADYWTVNQYLLVETKRRFDELDIEIPLSQLEVSIKKNLEGPNANNNIEAI